jgi:hypothetical protein
MRAEAHLGRELFLLYDYRGSYDAAPLSLISRQTGARLAEASELRSAAPSMHTSSPSRTALRTSGRGCDAVGEIRK